MSALFILFAIDFLLVIFLFVRLFLPRIGLVHACALLSFEGDGAEKFVASELFEQILQIVLVFNDHGLIISVLGFKEELAVSEASIGVLEGIGDALEVGSASNLPLDPCERD